jgi:hypothetical protein
VIKFVDDHQGKYRWLRESKKTDFVRRPEKGKADFTALDTCDAWL